jgi:hypothetical protein
MSTGGQGTGAVRRRRRGVSSESDTPFSDAGDVRGRPAVLAYHVAVCGLVPGLGLLLGPAAVVLGVRARLLGRKDPAFKGRSLANVALVLGLLLAVTQWAGLALMILGLRGG